MMVANRRICSGWRTLLFCLPVIFLFPLLLSVLELHQQPSKDLQREKPRKFDHLVLGPAAGEGLPNRLQCQGTRALNSTQFSAFSTHSDCGEHIAFVTVFTTYNTSADQINSKVNDLVTVGNLSYNKLERSLAILNVFINFIQVTMPKSNVIILTDPSSELPVRRNGVIIHPIQGEYSRDRLMLQRIRSYIAFLGTKLQEHSRGQGETYNYIFTDSDIAVVDDLGQFFHDYPDFHLALTFRNNKEQPLNSGFIAVRGTIEGIIRAKAFLEKVLEVYIKRFMKASRMLGDQLALAWIVKSQTSFDARIFTKRRAFIHEVSGASVLFLPCSIYNWTPPEGAGQFHGMPLDVKVVHFKGSRKRLMLEAWNFLSSLSDSEYADMLCLIVKSGRTKYDF